MDFFFLWITSWLTACVCPSLWLPSCPAKDSNFRSTLLLQVFQRQWKKPVTQMEGISLVTCMEASKNAWGKTHTHTSSLTSSLVPLHLTATLKKLPRNPKGHFPEIGSFHPLIQALLTDFTTSLYSGFLSLAPFSSLWETIESPDSQAPPFMI